MSKSWGSGVWNIRRHFLEANNLVPIVGYIIRNLTIRRWILSKTKISLRKNISLIPKNNFKKYLLQVGRYKTHKLSEYNIYKPNFIIINAIVIIMRPSVLVKS